MERLFILFDQKYREYQDCLYEKSWADAALAQSYLLGVIHSMWAVWDKDTAEAKQQFAEITHRSHLIDG